MNFFQKNTSSKSLISRSYLNAILGILMLWGSMLWAALFFLLGLINAFLAKAVINKLKENNSKWFLPFLINLTLLLGVTSFKIEKKKDAEIQKPWQPAISKKDFYIGSMPYIKQMNFSFDSLTIDKEEIRNLNLSTKDEESAPPDAPPD